jgi:amino acid permease
VVYGGPLGQMTKKFSKGWHYVLRLIFFVFVCGFLYGFITVYSAKLMHQYLSKFNDSTYVGVLFAAFLILGCLAEKKRQL